MTSVNSLTELMFPSAQAQSSCVSIFMSLFIRCISFYSLCAGCSIEKQIVRCFFQDQAVSQRDFDAAVPHRVLYPEGYIS